MARACRPTIPEISHELGLARSTAWLITKDIGRKPGLSTSARRSDAAKQRWNAYEERRSLERSDARFTVFEQIGRVSDRELTLIGAALYWAEGTKSKPWSRRERLEFINSDPNVIGLYLAWLRVLGVAPERMSFRVSIHESADVNAAERFWSKLVGIERSELMRTTLKQHVPTTVRKNVGADYHGCLVVVVRRSVREYWRTEDVWAAIIESIGCRAQGGRM